MTVMNGIYAGIRHHSARLCRHQHNTRGTRSMLSQTRARARAVRTNERTLPYFFFFLMLVDDLCVTIFVTMVVVVLLPPECLGAILLLEVDAFIL